jgi:hypothetical protein
MQFLAAECDNIVIREIVMRSRALFPVNKYRARFRFILSVVSLISCSALFGCVSIPGKNGTVHYLIVGFGVVSVNDVVGSAVTATNAHVLGISFSDRPSAALAIGYSSSTVVTVADGAEDVRVEISQIPGRGLIVEAPSVKLTKHMNPEGETDDENSK